MSPWAQPPLGRNRPQRQIASLYIYPPRLQHAAIVAAVAIFRSTETFAQCPGVTPLLFIAKASSRLRPMISFERCRMENSLTSIGRPSRSRSSKLRLYVSIALLFLVAGGMIAFGHRASAELDSDASEVRDLFTKFVAAQNSHDVDTVKSMLWESPDMLFFSRGIEARGTEAAIDRLKQYYQGTWQLEPDMTSFHAAAISHDVVQILVPIAFTRSLPGGQPQRNTLLICQTFVRDEHGWSIASILPVANTRLK